jgi:spermidine synthase
MFLNKTHSFNWVNLVPMNFLKYQKSPDKKCLYQAPNNIYVYQYRQFRWILFNDLYVQSMINTSLPSKPLLPYLPAMILFVKQLQGNVCLLGLGGGGAIHAMKQSADHIVAVEKYSEMIFICQQYFYIHQQEQLDIIQQSAETFIQQNEKPFDHILIDLCDHFGFPKECRNGDFLRKCYQSLADDGVMVLNLTQHADIADFKPLLTEISGQKPLMISASGNWLLFLCKRTNGRQYLLNILEQQHLIQQYSWQEGIGEWLSLNTPLQQKLQAWRKKLLPKKSHIL